MSSYNSLGIYTPGVPASPETAHQPVHIYTRGFAAGRLSRDSNFDLLAQALTMVSPESADSDGALSTEPLPKRVKLMPYAHITDKPVETVREGEGEGLEAVKLKQIMACEIAGSFLIKANLNCLLYCLIVSSDVSVTTARARDRVILRYRFNGSPTLSEYDWARDYPYSVPLVEER
jgi:hypothetical protein